MLFSSVWFSWFSSRGLILGWSDSFGVDKIGLDYEEILWQQPIQATFLRTLWVFLGSFLVCHLLVTPLNTNDINISNWAKTAPTGFTFSKCQKWSLAKLILSAMDPPLSWAFYSLRVFIWVCTITRMVVQYFFIYKYMFGERELAN